MSRVEEPAKGLAGFPHMRTLSPALCLLLLLLAAGCNRAPDEDGEKPGVVTNIVDQALPDMRDAPAPTNRIMPVEAAPQIDTPQPDAAPVGLVPAAMQGRWTGAGDRCGDRSADLKLTVAPDQLLFHESVGTVKSVEMKDDGRAIVQAAFTGEGQSWTRTLGLRMANDGKALTITNDGTAVTRKRC